MFVRLSPGRIAGINLSFLEDKWFNQVFSREQEMAEHCHPIFHQTPIGSVHQIEHGTQKIV